MPATPDYIDEPNLTHQNSTPDEEFDSSDSPWLEEYPQTDTNTIDNLDQWETKIANSEWEQLESKFKKLGMREGILEHKDSFGQPGFDQGYTEGLALGKQFGKVMGASWLLEKIYSKKLINDPTSSTSSSINNTEQEVINKKLSLLTTAMSELEIDGILDKAHFEKYSTEVSSLTEDDNKPALNYFFPNCLSSPELARGTLAEEKYSKAIAELHQILEERSNKIAE